MIALNWTRDLAVPSEIFLKEKDLRFKQMQMHKGCFIVVAGALLYGLFAYILHQLFVIDVIVIL